MMESFWDLVRFVLVLAAVSGFVFVAFVATNRLLDRVLQQPSADPTSRAAGGDEAVADPIRIARARLDSREITQAEFEDIRQTLDG